MSGLSKAERKPAPQVDVTLGREMDTTWPRIEVPFPDGVTMTPAVKYSTPPSCRPLTLDLYRPGADTPKPAKGFPLIMFIHGGSWARGDSRASRPLKRFPWVLAAIAARGYAVASIDYRMVGEAIWPAQGHDVKAAVRYLRKNAAELGLDPNRFASWGCSCGAHLTAVIAATAGVDALSPKYDKALADVDDKVQAAVAWYGGFNMESIAQQSEQTGALSRAVRDMPEWNLLGGFVRDLDIDFVRSAGPINYVGKHMPPMLFMVGDKDKLIPHLQTLEMVDRMKKAGAKAELELIPGADHDFAGETYEQTRAWNQQAMNRTMQFLDSILYA